MRIKNEERRTKNWDCFGAALQSSTLAGVPESFMTHHKANGDTCERIGFARASGANPNSSFFILNSSLKRRKNI